MFSNAHNVRDGEASKVESKGEGGGDMLPPSFLCLGHGDEGLRLVDAVAAFHEEEGAKGR
jgi:hypothetical protein